MFCAFGDCLLGQRWFLVFVLDVLGTFRERGLREGMGQVLDTSVSRLCLLCLCRACKYPVFGVASISTCASQSWLVHLKASALLGIQFFRLFCSEFYFKSWWILLFKLSCVVTFFSGSFVQKWVSNYSACVPILWCKLFCCSWISSDLWSHLGFLPLFATYPDSALLSAGSSRSSCCSDPKGNSFGDTSTWFRCRNAGPK